MGLLSSDCFAFRARYNLSQKEMGRLCGVDRTIILDVEKNRPVSKMTETKIRLVLEGKK